MSGFRSGARDAASFERGGCGGHPPAIVDGAAEELAREDLEADRQAAERDDAILDQPSMQFSKSSRLTTLARRAIHLQSILPDSAVGERK